MTRRLEAPRLTTLFSLLRFDIDKEQNMVVTKLQIPNKATAVVTNFNWFVKKRQNNKQATYIVNMAKLRKASMSIILTQITYSPLINNQKQRNKSDDFTFKSIKRFIFAIG